MNVNQTVIQRFLSLENVNEARKSCIIYVVGVIILIGMCIFNGLLLYGTYHDCDPLTTKLVKKKDQLVPLLVMKIFKNIPGLPGLFIAGVFSGKILKANFAFSLFQNFFLTIPAALSSLSSGLNSLSALVLEDYFKPLFKERLSEKMTGLILRGTVVVLGVLSVALVYVVEQLGSVLQLSMSIPATCVGSLFGIFFIGMFLPWIGKRAALYGALIAAALMIVLVVRAEIDSVRGLIVWETKPTSVDGCMYNFTILEDSKSTSVNATQTSPRHISYLYYLPLGAIITCLSAFILSLIFGFEDTNNVDSRLLAPFMRKYFE